MGKKKKQTETIGDVLLEHEAVIQKMRKHGLQQGDVLYLTIGYIEVHCPDMIEEYTDGTRPVFSYRHRDNQ